MLVYLSNQNVKLEIKIDVNKTVYAPFIKVLVRTYVHRFRHVHLHVEDGDQKLRDIITLLLYDY